MNPTMNIDSDEDEDPFEHWRVVRNDNGDYSIWPQVKPLPGGWTEVGVEACRKECLDWIEQNWAGPTLR